MAENKKSFVLYTDLLKIVEQLPDDIAGKLFKIILRYVNDLEVSVDDLLLKIAFEPIKLQLKRDLEKYEIVKEKRSMAGKKSAEIKKQNSTKSTRVKSVQQTSTKSTVNDTVTDNVNDTVTVTDNVNGKKSKEELLKERKLKFASTLNPFLEKYGKDLLNDFFKYWTEPNKSETKFRQELEKTWDLERRLETWARNDKNFNHQKDEKGNGKPVASNR